MSGPKSSRYVMTPQQLQRLREQMEKAREERLLKERKEQELDVIRHYCDSIHSVIDTIEETLEQMERLQPEGEILPANITDIRKIIQENLNITRQAETISKTQKLEYIVETEKKLAATLKTLCEEVAGLETTLGRQKEVVIDKAVSKIVSGFDLSFASISDKKALGNSEYHKKIKEELKKLAGIPMSERLSNRFEKLKQKADEITSVDFLENFFSISVIPFVKACIEYTALEEEKGADYRNLRVRYECLSKELGRETEDIPLSKDCISILLSRIAELEEEALRIGEDAYISSCIDEAMREMNYSVVGKRDVTKKNGRHFRNILYKFDEDTAVNVTYGSDGQITMELGGISINDRMPTEEESVSLEQDMIQFCDDFHELEKKLRRKGIEPKQMTHLPPQAQFAQLINISDYDMIGEMATYKAKKSRQKTEASSAAKLHKGY